MARSAARRRRGAESVERHAGRPRRAFACACAPAPSHRAHLAERVHQRPLCLPRRVPHVRGGSALLRHPALSRRPHGDHARLLGSPGWKPRTVTVFLFFLLTNLRTARGLRDAADRGGWSREERRRVARGERPRGRGARDGCASLGREGAGCGAECQPPVRSPAPCGPGAGRGRAWTRAPRGGAGAAGGGAQLDCAARLGRNAPARMTRLACVHGLTRARLHRDLLARPACAFCCSPPPCRPPLPPPRGPAHRHAGSAGALTCIGPA